MLNWIWIIIPFTVAFLAFLKLFLKRCPTSVVVCLPLRCWTRCSGWGRRPAAWPLTPALRSTSRSLKGFWRRWRWWVDAAKGRERDDSSGGGRGRFVTFPPLVRLGGGGGWEGEGRGGSRQKTNSFVFLLPRLSPISGRDKRGTKCGRGKMIGCGDFMCWTLLCLMQDRNRGTLRPILRHRWLFLCPQKVDSLHCNIRSQ